MFQTPCSQLPLISLNELFIHKFILNQFLIAMTPVIILYFMSHSQLLMCQLFNTPTILHYLPYCHIPIFVYCNIPPPKHPAQSMAQGLLTAGVSDIEWHTSFLNMAEQLWHVTTSKQRSLFSLLNPQPPEQCLEYTRCLMNVHGMNEKPLEMLMKIIWIHKRWFFILYQITIERKHFKMDNICNHIQSQKWNGGSIRYSCLLL